MFVTTLAGVASHQLTLLGVGEPRLAEVPRFERVELDATTWIDVARGWLLGADSLLQLLADTVEWHQGRRHMYDRMVDDPRLSHWFARDDPLPHPVFESAKCALQRRYRVRFGSMGVNYYRDGNDSVAWHSDRELREVDDSLIAIVTLGGPRPFLVRPKGGGPSRNIAPASGDLLVMGGSCQRDWEHHVPKVKRAGPRMSCTWRWSRKPAARTDP